MTITPQGQLYLCKTPLENDYKNQLTFASANAQLTYFNSTIQRTFDNYTYIKKDDSIKVGVNIDEIIDCNYLFYKNTGFTNKYYFCFITNMEYVNENCTLITFETDCFQTWQFQIVYKQSFVEREHVNDDTIGLNTIPENLETGEYIVNSKEYDTSLDTLVYVIQCTEWSTTSNDPPLAFNYGGIFYAGGAYVCDDITEVVNILQAFASRGKSDAVYNVYMVPSSFITRDSDPRVLKFPGQTAPITLTKTINKVTTLNGYSPRNNKLKCFPFNYMVISNNNGSSNILHYERFSGSTCNFTIKGVPTVRSFNKIDSNQL